ncbi:hypothetical protein Q7P36_005545 [Cladosporium allicinum]
MVDNHHVEDIARRVASSISERMPEAISQLLQSTTHGNVAGLRLECNLILDNASSPGPDPPRQVISIDVAPLLQQLSSVRETSIPLAPPSFDRAALPPLEAVGTPSSAIIETRNFRPRSALISPAPTPEDLDDHPSKIRKATGGLRVRVDANAEPISGPTTNTARRLESDGRVFPQRKKNVGDNPVFQPSSLQKFVKGVWESIYSSIRMDPTEVIEQWQAIESNGQPKLLTSTDNEISNRESSLACGTFGRMSILARKLSQTSRTCRSLEVIVQARWVQLFDDRVHQLTASMTKEKAKKATIAEACLDFHWTEKELRNKMGVWRGYHDIQKAGGWAALVFAGMGLYRFCKYRVSFNEESFQSFRALKHRFEVAADTLHPRWRQLLGIVGASTERKYTGHPHDYVIGASNNEAIPLATTYHQWDKDFSYTHLDTCQIDEEAWGLYDPRVVQAAPTQDSHICQICHERQSDDPPQNNCNCFPNLYPQTGPHIAPVQVYRTPNGRNNGLIACLPFDRGTAVGEFVGQVTSGLSGLDVMVGQTGSDAYQIWQGRQGNYTRFVNHSCQPNSQYERFMWMSTQRIVLVSKGIEAGDEITVDYSDTYWKNLDKDCLCGQPKCRYKSRLKTLTPPLSR